jgi:uncharacterized protein (TIGR03067 family)
MFDEGGGQLHTEPLMAQPEPSCCVSGQFAAQPSVSSGARIRSFAALWVLCLALLPIAGCGKVKTPAEEMKDLEGTWLIESFTDGTGKPASFPGPPVGVDPFEPGGLIIFAGTQSYFKPKNAGDLAEGKSPTYSYEVNPAVNPKTLDMSLKQKVEMQLIYALDGDSLRLGMSYGPDHRPRELGDKSSYSIVLRRQK